MAKRKTRPMNEAERVIIKGTKVSIWENFEKTVMFILPSVMVLLIPFLILDKYYSVPSHIEFWIALIILIVGIAGGIWLRRKIDPPANNQLIDHILKQGMVEVEVFDIVRAARRDDPEDFGDEYYLELADGRVIFLQDQALLIDFVDEHNFPNTQLELAYCIPSRFKPYDDLIGIRTLGKYLQESIELPARSMKAYRDGKVLGHGQIIEKSIEELIKD